jgi:hypothetical protein
MGHLGIAQGQGGGALVDGFTFQQSHQQPGQEAVTRAHGVGHHHGGGFAGVPGAAIAVQQHGTLGPQRQGGPGGGGQGQQVAGLVQRGGAGQGQQGQVVVAGLDQVGLGQGRQHAGAVGRHVRDDGGAQVGIHHHQAAGGALRRQPRQVGRAVVGHQGQAAGGHHLQAGGLLAGQAEAVGTHLAVGHAFPVKAVAGFAVPVQTHHGQRGGLWHGFGAGQGHAGVVDAGGQQAAIAVGRQRVEVERAHALKAQGAREVVHRPPRAGQQAALLVFDHVHQGLTGGGDLKNGGAIRENHK